MSGDSLGGGALSVSHRLYRAVIAGAMSFFFRRSLVKWTRGWRRHGQPRGGFRLGTASAREKFPERGGRRRLPGGSLEGERHLESAGQRVRLAMRNTHTIRAAVRFTALFISALLISGVFHPAAAQAQSASLVFTSTTGVAAGVSGPGASPTGGFEEELGLSGRFQAGVLRLTAQATTRFSTGIAATARWAAFDASQTLRWSWPGWTTSTAASAEAEAEAPATLATVEIQELAAALSGNVVGLGLRFELGKFPLKWGVGKAFRPSDIFRTIDYSSLIPAPSGLPAARLALFPSALSRFEAAAAIDGEGTTTAGARYLTAIGDAAAVAASCGWRRESGTTDEYSASLEGQIDLGAFTPYAEISYRNGGADDSSGSAGGGGDSSGGASSSESADRGSGYALAMAGSSLAAGDFVFWLEGQRALGVAEADSKLFFLGTWKLSELTSVSVPVAWFETTSALSSGLLAQLQGVWGGTLSLSASASLLYALSPAPILWKASLLWSRSLATY